MDGRSFSDLATASSRISLDFRARKHDLTLEVGAVRWYRARVPTANPVELARAYYTSEIPSDEPYATGDLLLAAPYLPVGSRNASGSARMVVVDNTCDLVRDQPPQVVLLARALDLMEWLAADGKRFDELRELLDGRLVDFEWLPAIPGVTNRNGVLLDLVVDFADVVALPWALFKDEIRKRSTPFRLTDGARWRVVQRYGQRSARISRPIDPERYRLAPEAQGKARRATLTAADFARVRPGPDESTLQPTSEIAATLTTRRDDARALSFVQAAEQTLGYRSAGFDDKDALENLVRRLRRQIGLGANAQDEALAATKRLIATYGFEAKP